MSQGARCYWLPRRGNSPSEYEDAFALNEIACRFALADGASESCFAVDWARILVEAFAASADLEQWGASLPSLEERWDAEVNRQPIPWHALNGVQRGAFAAFLGVEVERMFDGSVFWNAVAVGDACLLHSRGDALVAAFPVDSSRLFNNAPKLIGSRMSAEELHVRLSCRQSGEAYSGDRLWLATDALAKFCLAEHESGRPPWRELEMFADGSAPADYFIAWIEQLRTDRRLQNDDVTLIAIPL